VFRGETSRTIDHAEERGERLETTHTGRIACPSLNGSPFCVGEPLCGRRSWNGHFEINANPDVPWYSIPTGEKMKELMMRWLRTPRLINRSPGDQSMNRLFFGISQREKSSNTLRQRSQFSEGRLHMALGVWSTLAGQKHGVRQTL
jgi:hypothetical protein